MTPTDEELSQLAATVRTFQEPRWWAGQFSLVLGLTARQIEKFTALCTLPAIVTTERVCAECGSRLTITRRSDTPEPDEDWCPVCHAIARFDKSTE